MNNQPTTANQISKISTALEIIQAMRFLGISTDKFRNMRIQAGGLQELHSQMAEQLGS
jgi:hypothetical protein